MRTVARWVSRVLDGGESVDSSWRGRSRRIPRRRESPALTSSATYAKREIGRYSIRPAPGRSAARAPARPGPQWSNPIVGEIYGDVFIWTSKGRPEVIGSLHKWYSPHNHSAIEFLSLSTGSTRREPGRSGDLDPLSTRDRDEADPRCSRPGGDARPAAPPDARAWPRTSPAARPVRRQRERDTRLLSQPIYRYVNSEAPVVDGALFVFVQGTDPETFLLIEAASGGREGPMAVWPRPHEPRRDAGESSRPGGLGGAAAPLGAGRRTAANRTCRFRVPE